LRITSSQAVAQLRGRSVIDIELAGIDDAMSMPGLDGVVEEHRASPAHRLVAAEEKLRFETPPEIWHAGSALDLARRLDEVDAVVVMLLDAGRDREDVGIEDDVFGRKADAGEQML
jgi:hypothetical protein